jgi:hypothetical protein
MAPIPRGGASKSRLRAAARASAQTRVQTSCGGWSRRMRTHQTERDNESAPKTLSRGRTQELRPAMAQAKNTICRAEVF